MAADAELVGQVFKKNQMFPIANLPAMIRSVLSFAAPSGAAFYLMTIMMLSFNQSLTRRVVGLCAAGALAVTLAACGDHDKSGAAKGSGDGGQPPPPEVAVLKVEPQTVAITTELPGRLEPVRIAQVRARATGILQKRVFTEGSDVKAGEVLYRIDPAPYRATLQSAQAQVAQAEAQLADASSRAKRYKPLVKANAVSRQEYDAAVAAEKAAAAQVAAAKAAVRSADINLNYTTVHAPIAGRIGRSLVTEGALVSAQEATQMATIQQIDKLYVNFTRPVADVLQLREALKQGEIERAKGKEAARVDVLLENGQAYPHAGRLLFTDLTVDPGTGQVNLRAEVPNPEGYLLPGMYVRVALEQAQIDNAVLLPQQAVTRAEQGNTVMVIPDDGKPEKREVTIEGSHGNQWVVSGGLEPGDQVMVEGAMRLAMGAQKVKPVPWKPNAGPAAKGDGPAEGAAPADKPTEDSAPADTDAGAGSTPNDAS